MSAAAATSLLHARRTRSADGTSIAYYATTPPFAEAPVLVLAAGLGAHHRAWRPLVAYFADRLRVIAWDYRGLFGSASPIPATVEAYGLPRQLDDLEAVLRAEEVDRMAMLGWSMGVQVALEAYRRAPERIVSLVLINGVAGCPRGARGAMRYAVRLMGRLVGLSAHGKHAVSWATRTASRRQRVADLLQRTGLMGSSVDPERLAELVGDAAEINVSTFTRTLRAVAEHDASAVLPTVAVPSLILAGDADPLAPPALAQNMARLLPRSEISMVPGGRHHLCLEYPDLVNLRLERFFEETGLC